MPIYHALCQVLAGQPDRVNWSGLSPADWDLLVARARAEGVAPLLYYLLNPTGWPAQMPAHVGRDLRAAYYATAAHNALIYRELSRILTAIGNFESQIPVVVLKGAALAVTVYPDSVLRPLRDVDLLIHRQHLEPVLEAMQDLGYREAYPSRDAGLNPVLGYDVHLRGGPSDSVILDLHWNLIGGDADWRAPSTEWFWDQTERWKVEGGKWKGGEGKREGRRRKGKGGTEDQSSNSHSPFSIFQPPSSILQLTPTAHLLYLSAHLMLQHGAAQARLIWYYDLRLLVTRRGGRLDWGELAARARELRWAAALHAALRGMQERFGTPLPAGFLDRLAETEDLQSAHLVARKAGSIQSRTTSTWDKLASLGWAARLRLAWSVACPSPEYLRWRYKPQPAWLWPLYYPYRWLDILRDGLTTLWHILRKRS